MSYVKSFPMISFLISSSSPLVLCLSDLIYVQDYMTHGSQGLFTQAGYNDPSQDDGSQNHFGMSNVNSLQSQVNLLFNSA